MSEVSSSLSRFSIKRSTNNLPSLFHLSQEPCHHSLSLSLGIGNVLGSRIIPAALPWWAPDSIFLRPTKIRLSLVQSAIAMVFRNTYLRVHDGTHCSRATRVIGEPYKIRIFSFFFFQSYEEKRKNRNRGRKLWKYPRWYIFNGWNLFKENEEMEKWRRASSSFFFLFIISSWTKNKFIRSKWKKTRSRRSKNRIRLLSIVQKKRNHKIKKDFTSD